MCGVNLVVNDPECGEANIQVMMGATQHRGPDHSEWKKLVNGTFIAGNRLKTLDILSPFANQPLSDPEATVSLVWNGFLYNYQELRNELLDFGEIFQTLSDGEVLLKYLKRFGASGLKQVKGMFALAFVDLLKQEVILARDPIGMKSLYLWHHKNQLYCSSEVKSFLQLDDKKFEFDETQLIPYLYTRHTLPTGSFIKGIEELGIGSVRIFNFEGREKSSFELVVPEIKQVSGSIGYFKELLTDAVLNHFHADVPVGMILSGGADSTLLYHSWYRETGVPLHSFTVGFETAYRKKYQDLAYASEFIKSFQGRHHELVISPDEFLEAWPDYIRSLDQPVGDSAGFLTWMIARKAKSEVKILISGAGADELFGGYNRHNAFRFYLKYSRLLSLLPLGKKQRWLFGREGQKFLDALRPDPGDTFMNFAALKPLPEKLAASLRDLYPDQPSSFKAALEWDRSFYLVHDILKIHDNACMAHGIEGRAPYLDWPLVALSQGMDEQQHLSLPPKYWIKQTLKEAGLGRFAYRKKLGFGLPLMEWMRDHREFQNFIFTKVSQFGRLYGDLIPPEWRNLIAFPSKYAKKDFLQLYNIFLLSEWIRENDL